MQVSDMLKRLFMLFLAASVALAIFRGMPANPSDWYGWADEQLVDIKSWIGGIADNVFSWVDQQPEPENILPNADQSGKDGKQN